MQVCPESASLHGRAMHSLSTASLFKAGAGVASLPAFLPFLGGDEAPGEPDVGYDNGGWICKVN